MMRRAAAGDLSLLWGVFVAAGAQHRVMLRSRPFGCWKHPLGDRKGEMPFVCLPVLVTVKLQAEA
jgi:hypothetical protein